MKTIGIWVDEVIAVMTDATILRLFVSQAFAIYFLLILIPLKEPRRKNLMVAIFGAFLITFSNALLILFGGITFYIRVYLLTLTLPYIVLGSYLAFHKGGKFIFAVLTIQIIGTVAIINGLLASYVFYGENNPLIDTFARAVTYIVFLPVVYKFIRPIYLKMAESLNKGWWILNAALILSYMLTYYILFVPVDIFKRPEYFAHAYIGIVLSLLIYGIIFYLFIEIKTKLDIEQDKMMLSTKVRSLTAQSDKINIIAYKDLLTGVKNRYSLFIQMDHLIQKQQPFLVAFIDLDNLKEINDTYDHSKGDIYIKHFALTVQEAIKDYGEVYRFAGDEFVCLVTDDLKQFDPKQFEAVINNEMNLDVAFLGFSLGLASYPEDALNSDALISFADQAMYIEKKQKKQPSNKIV